MSRASVQALSLLAFSAGAVRQLQDRCVISRVDCKESLQIAYDAVCKAINQWPESGDGPKNTKKIEAALREWSDLECQITASNKTAVLLATCERALVDLHERLNNKRCKALVAGILEPVAAVWAVYGKDGAMFSVHEEAAAMVEPLQKIIGWEE